MRTLAAVEADAALVRDQRMACEREIDRLTTRLVDLRETERHFAWEYSRTKRRLEATRTTPPTDGNCPGTEP